MVPKGGVDKGEQPHDAAIREFEEEVGVPPPANPVHLCRIRQSGGKIVEVFTAEGDFDPDDLESILFEMEWPPRSGEIRRFPEADKARWMTLAKARQMMLPSQLPMLEALEAMLKEME